MAWFIAHAVLAVEFKVPPQETVPCFENLYLIEALEREDVWEKAERRAQEDVGDFGGSFTWDGRSARLVMRGIRKVVDCDSLGGPLRDLLEVSHLQLEFANSTLAEQYARGEAVVVRVLE